MLVGGQNIEGMFLKEEIPGEEMFLKEEIPGEVMFLKEEIQGNGGQACGGSQGGRWGRRGQHDEINMMK